MLKALWQLQHSTTPNAPKTARSKRFYSPLHIARFVGRDLLQDRTCARIENRQQPGIDFVGQWQECLPANQRVYSNERESKSHLRLIVLDCCCTLRRSDVPQLDRLIVTGRGEDRHRLNHFQVLLRLFLHNNTFSTAYQLRSACDTACFEGGGRSGTKIALRQS